MSKFDDTFSNVSAADNPTKNADRTIQNTVNAKPQVIDMEEGYLQILAQDDVEHKNLVGANVTILTVDEQNVLFYLLTDKYGLTKTIALPAPARKYSLDIKSIIVPYSVYTVRIKFAGYSTVVYKNIQVFASTTSLQVCYLTLLPEDVDYEKQIVLPPHILVQK